MSSLYSNPESSSVTSNITPSPDSSLPRKYQEQVENNLQMIFDEIDRMKQHDYDVIEKLSHACQVFSTVSLLLKLYLIPFAILVGLVLMIYLLSIEIYKFPFFNWIFGTLSLGSIISIYVSSKSLPDSIKMIEKKFASIEREHQEIKEQIDYLKKEFAAMKVNCKEQHPAKKTVKKR